MTAGKNAFEKMECLHQKQESKMQYLRSISKTTEWFFFCQFISKENHSVSQKSKSMPQLLMPKKLKLNGSLNTRPRTNTKKRSLFHYRGLEWKVGSQEIPGVTGKIGLGVQNEAGQRLIEFCQENALVIANTLFQQHKRRLYTWTSSDVQCQNQTDYILCSWRWRSSI